MDFSDRAKKKLAKEGYDSVFGARPLKRVIQKRILDMLAKDIIKGQITEGDSVTVDFNGKNFLANK